MKNNAISEFGRVSWADILSCYFLFFQAMNKCDTEECIVTNIKEKFDTKYNPSWHVTIGRNYGSYVTHEYFIYFKLGKVGLYFFSKKSP